MFTVQTSRLAPVRDMKASNMSISRCSGRVRVECDAETRASGSTGSDLRRLCGRQSSSNTALQGPIESSDVRCRHWDRFCVEVDVDVGDRVTASSALFEQTIGGTCISHLKA
jgi:hypothetical protein